MKFDNAQNNLDGGIFLHSKRLVLGEPKQAGWVACCLHEHMQACEAQFAGCIKAWSLRLRTVSGTYGDPLRNSGPASMSCDSPGKTLGPLICQSSSRTCFAPEVVSPQG